MTSIFKLTIVGGGLTATSMLCQFSDKALELEKSGMLNPHLIEVTVFEKTDDFGPGFPHSDRHLMSFHITNMCAADMSVYANKRGDFQSWINQNQKHLKARYPDYPADVFEPPSNREPRNHYPRAFMGEYLRTRFKEAVKAARQMGMAVNLNPLHEVTDIRPERAGLRVTVCHVISGHRFKLKFDALLLATGH